MDINCDVGEGVGNERELLPLISSCSIACGGHAGNEKSMRETIRLAMRHRVKIGAHPAYPDRQNFGRISMDISRDALSKSIHEQLTTFTSILKEENAILHHIKPHGALYNDLAKDEALCNTFLKSIAMYKSGSVLYVPFGSLIEQMATIEGFGVKREAFADRNYDNQLHLVSRKFSDAVLTEPTKVLNHLKMMVTEKKVRTAEGNLISIQADTYCIHGDTPDALKILTYISQKLPELNITTTK
ncbi:5-oxoprolinase subunit PxpA [Aggregatimonas sangjinii]|uniref:5-oxoprolinase subunit PxpA n=1 Tax=Aggregatimonas sangjinii TaxID=2583587 RepID=A0A5B7SUW2_9FLAO|nr:5-oxoprolinase subunit PxpA [Aggregatimonas sangjinii]